MSRRRSLRSNRPPTAILGGLEFPGGSTGARLAALPGLSASRLPQNKKATLSRIENSSMLRNRTSLLSRNPRVLPNRTSPLPQNPRLGPKRSRPLPQNPPARWVQELQPQLYPTQSPTAAFPSHATPANQHETKPPLYTAGHNYDGNYPENLSQHHTHIGPHDKIRNLPDQQVLHTHDDRPMKRRRVRTADEDQQGTHRLPQNWYQKHPLAEEEPVDSVAARRRSRRLNPAARLGFGGRMPSLDHESGLKVVSSLFELANSMMDLVAKWKEWKKEDDKDELEDRIMELEREIEALRGKLLDLERDIGGGVIDEDMTD